MSTRLSDDSISKVWKSHLDRAADEISERLAAEAAENFKAELKRKLVASMGVFLENTMSMERLGSDLRITVKMEN